MLLIQCISKEDVNLLYIQLRFQPRWFWWILHNSTIHIQTVERYWCLEMTSWSSLNQNKKH